MLLCFYRTALTSDLNLGKIPLVNSCLAHEDYVLSPREDHSKSFNEHLRNHSSQSRQPSVEEKARRTTIIPPRTTTEFAPRAEADSAARNRLEPLILPRENLCSYCTPAPLRSIYLCNLRRSWRKSARTHTRSSHGGRSAPH